MTRWANRPDIRKNMGMRTGSITVLNHCQPESFAPGTPLITCM